MNRQNNKKIMKFNSKLVKTFKLSTESIEKNGNFEKSKKILFIFVSEACHERCKQFFSSLSLKLKTTKVYSGQFDSKKHLPHAGY